MLRSIFVFWLGGHLVRAAILGTSITGTASYPNTTVLGLLSSVPPSNTSSTDAIRSEQLSTTITTIQSSSTTVQPTSITTAPKPETSSHSCLYPINPALGNVGWNDWSNCMRPGNPQILGGAYNPYEWVSWNPSVSSSCSSIFETSLDDWKATAPITTSVITFLDEDSRPTDYSRTYVNYVDFFSFIPQKGSDCCLNCTVYGGDVQVFYWPTPAPSPAVTALVDPAGFTFVSPSVYVAFQSLYATNDCGNFGTAYESTTLAFAPGQLSTAMAWQWNGSAPVPPYLPNDFVAADWNDNNDCQNLTRYFLQDDMTGLTYTDYDDMPYSCHTGGCWIDQFTITWNPCSPTLSVPKQIFTIDPEWSGCMQGIDAFFDPPYTLTSGRGFRPLTITAPAVSVDPGIITSATAQPAHTTPNVVSPTPVGSPLPTIVSNSSPASRTIDPDPTSRTSIQDLLPPSPWPNDPAQSQPSVSAIRVKPSQDPSIPAPVKPASPEDPTLPAPLVIESHTMTQGAAPVTISRHTYSLDPSAPIIFIDSQPSPLPIPVVSPTLWMVAGQTITPGAAPVIISHHTYSIDPAATAIFVDGEASSLPSVPDPSSYVVAGQTIYPGGEAATIGGTTYSMASSAGNTVLVNGQPSAIMPPTPSEYVIAGQTLSAGGAAITVSGRTYSLAPTGGGVVIDGTTQHFAQPGSSTYLIGSQTIVAGGPAITISGTVVSLMPGGSSIDVGGTTEPIQGFVAASTTNNGATMPVISLNGFATPTSHSSATRSDTASPSRTSGNVANVARAGGIVPIVLVSGLWISFVGILSL